MIKRIYNIFLGLLGLGVKKIETTDVGLAAAVDREKEAVRGKLAQISKALGEHAANGERLGEKMLNLQNEEKTLKAKIQGLLTAGKRELALTLATRLQEVTRELGLVTTELTNSQEQMKILSTARDVTTKEVEKRVSALTSKISDLKMRKAAADLNEITASTVSALGSASDSFTRLEQQLDDERFAASGRAAAARGQIDTSGFEAQQEIDAALAEGALKEFEASLGLPSPDPLKDILDTPVVKDMTPA